MRQNKEFSISEGSEGVDLGMKKRSGIRFYESLLLEPWMVDLDYSPGFGIRSMGNLFQMRNADNPKERKISRIVPRMANPLNQFLLAYH